MQCEKRRHTRHSAKKGTLAAFLPRLANHDLFIGEILDISTGGLSLRYSARREHTEVPSHVEIFGYSPHFIHIRLPARIVYDFALKSGTKTCPKARRCGVQFGEIPELQLAQLEDFIRNDVLGNASKKV